MDEWIERLGEQFRQHHCSLPDNDNDYLRGRVSPDPMEDLRFVRGYAMRLKRGDFPLMDAAQRSTTIDFLRAYEDWIISTFITPDAAVSGASLKIIARHHPEWFQHAPETVRRAVFE